MTACLKNRAETFENLLGELREFWAAVVDDRLVDRPQNSVGYVSGARDLEKVATSVNHSHSIRRLATGSSLATEFTSDGDRRKQSWLGIAAKALAIKSRENILVAASSE
jgi:hypothetical protein